MSKPEGPTVGLLRRKKTASLSLLVPMPATCGVR